ncbi:hypothetical protein [[Mycobacterium] appelbergii]|uniref:hypothetical protein n=1 Tax=[Mycobacterium] appelbergii TaxID=2939269 RepID=UPI00293919C3|nr:hypothetical protein [Mycobacterium sp. 21AC1]
MDPPEALYSADLVAIARFVKELTDLGTPAPAVEVAVAELRGRPDAAFRVALGNGSRRAAFDGGRIRGWVSVGAAAAVALIIGGAVGVYAGSGSQRDSTASDPVAVAKAVPAEAVTPAVKKVPAVPAVPAKADPVCAEWGRVAASFSKKQQAWAKTDPRVPASRWSPKQRAVTLAVIPVMKEEAAAMRRLADKAVDPFLVGIMKGQAVYEDEYAKRLPKFQPRDHDYWQAASALRGTVKSVCSAVK